MEEIIFLWRNLFNLSTIKQVIMGVRINHNINAINAHRLMLKNDQDLGKTLQRLSSGIRVNSAAEGPATLVISEHMRAQIGGLKQALDNNEAAVSLVQTAEGALTEVNRLLIDIRQRAVHAANEGINDDTQLAADQAEIENALAAIDRIAQNTQFGQRRLLDGSRATTGSTQDLTIAENGEKVVQFLGASAATKVGEEQEYEVFINENATRAFVDGTLDQLAVQNGMTLSVRSEGKVVKYKTNENDTVSTALEGFAAAIERAGLKISIQHDVTREASSGTFSIVHHQYGSKKGFSASSSESGVFTGETGEALENEEIMASGTDIRGTINGEIAIGDGTIMIGKRGNRFTDGLKLRINGSAPANTVVGLVRVRQNALQFQVGANEGQTVAVSMLDTSSTQIAREVGNDSGFSSLADVDVRTTQGAQDSIRLVDKAIEEISANRGLLGAFQRNTLESNIYSLRVAAENLTAAESVLRDADMAQELTNFTRSQILTQAATAQLAQANAMPQNVLGLLASQ